MNAWTCSPLPTKYSCTIARAESLHLVGALLFSRVYCDPVYFRTLPTVVENDCSKRHEAACALMTNRTKIVGPFTFRS